MLLPLPYVNNLDAAIFWITYLIWLVPEIVGSARQRGKQRKDNATIQDRGSMIFLLVWLYIGIALNFMLPVLLPQATITWHRTTIFFIGIALILLGVAFRWYAIGTLGRYFTRDVAASSSQQVIQSGPYRFIRHPAYSGTLLTMIGIGLAVTNWASLIAIFFCTLIGHLYRVRIEERALSQTIGQPYVEYMGHTRRFIPFIF